jgi:hypothetical protein
MDNTIKLISVIIWPLIILFLALFYQGSIKELLARLKSASTSGLTFSEKAEEARNEAETISEARNEDETISADIPDEEWVRRLKDQAAYQPWLVVRQAWHEVRRVAREKMGGTSGDGLTTPQRIKPLRDKKLISEDTYRLANTLHGLYFDMRKAPDQVSAPAAVDYVEACAAVVKELESVALEAPQTGNDPPVAG